MRFHKSTLGQFGNALSTDQEGYDREYARDAAERSREAARKLDQWQREN